MPFVITGSGRSGTSMVTRMLSLCGLHIGSSSDMTSSADQFNPTGYWEHRSFYSINERILRRFGGSELVPPKLPQDWQHDSSLADLVADANIAIQSISRKQLVWGWKDPRASLLLPFWNMLIPDLKVIVCVRNPLDVAVSSNRYVESYGSMVNCLGRNQGLINWHTYTIAAIKDSQPDARILTFYDEYFPDFHPPLEPLLEFVGLAPVRRGSTIDNKIREFHNPALKHYSSSINDLCAAPDVPAQVKELYVTLTGCRENPQERDERLLALIEKHRGMPVIDVASYDERKLCEIVNGYILLESRRLQLEGTLKLRPHLLASRVSSALEWRRRPILWLQTTLTRLCKAFPKETSRQDQAARSTKATTDGNAEDVERQINTPKHQADLH